MNRPRAFIRVCIHAMQKKDSRIGWILRGGLMVAWTRKYANARNGNRWTVWTCSACYWTAPKSYGRFLDWMPFENALETGFDQSTHQVGSSSSSLFTSEIIRYFSVFLSSKQPQNHIQIGFTLSLKTFFEHVIFLNAYFCLGRGLPLFNHNHHHCRNSNIQVACHLLYVYAHRIVEEYACRFLSADLFVPILSCL